jgi:hypothetical protein
MPLVGGLCHVQRTSPARQHDAPHRRTLSRTTDFALVNGSDHLLRSCPSSEDFVTYNGLRLFGTAPARRTSSRTTDLATLGHHDAPRRRTLSRTTDFAYLALPLLGGLCHVQRTWPRSGTMMPLVGGLCRVQRTSHSSMGVTTSYDRAPRRRTLSRTTDLDPLGHNDLTTR